MTHHIHQFLHHLVPCEVPVGIIDPLEVVDMRIMTESGLLSCMNSQVVPTIARRSTVVRDPVSASCIGEVTQALLHVLAFGDVEESAVTARLP